MENGARSMLPQSRVPDPPLTYQPTFHFSPTIKSTVDFDVYHELLKSYVSTLDCLQYFASMITSTEIASAVLWRYALELQQKVLVVHQAMLDYLNEAVNTRALDCSTAVRQSQSVRELLDTCNKYVVSVSAIVKAIEVTKVKRGSVTVVSVGSQLARDSKVQEFEPPSSPSSVATTIFDLDDEGHFETPSTLSTPPTPSRTPRQASESRQGNTSFRTSLNFSRRDVGAIRPRSPPDNRFRDTDAVDEDEYEGPATWHELPNGVVDGDVERPDSRASTFLYPLASTITLASRKGILRPRRPRG